MNKFIASAFCLLAIVATLEAVPSPQYTTKYDNINLDEILKNDRLLQAYFGCIMDKPDAKCTPEGTELKKTMPDAIETECASCSPKQKEGVEKVIKFLHDNKPDEWSQLTKKFDPKGKLQEKYKNQADKLFSS